MAARLPSMPEELVQLSNRLLQGNADAPAPESAAPAALAQAPEPPPSSAALLASLQEPEPQQSEAEINDLATFRAAQRAAHAQRARKRQSLLVLQQRESAIPPAEIKLTWSVDAAVASEKGVSALREFCAVEHSEESLEFIVAASAWRGEWEEHDETQRKQGADKIFEQFLDSGAPLEICVPSGKGVPRDAPLKPTMFDDAMRYARTTLIMDIWPRFEESPLATDLRVQLFESSVAASSPASKPAAPPPSTPPSKGSGNGQGRKGSSRSPPGSGKLRWRSPGTPPTRNVSL